MSGLADVVKAADFAARKHKDQRRKAADQLPYINHPIGVAHILMSEGGIDDPIVLTKLIDMPINNNSIRNSILPAMLSSGNAIKINKHFLSQTSSI